jgi:hypothetical protein
MINIYLNIQFLYKFILSLIINDCGK